MRNQVCGHNIAALTVLGVATLAAAGHVATYSRWRARCLGWGATQDELDVALPGDDLLAQPEVQSTRAITIMASVEDVWPWLVQMGPGRGGAYTYDWIENVFGLGMHSADEVLPQFQDLKVGDDFRLGPRGPVLRVAVLDAPQAMVVRSEDGNWVWAFCLRTDGSSTRLISRNRISAPDVSKATQLLNRYVMEPGSLVMERKMLGGIKDRAEHLAQSRHAAPAPENEPDKPPPLMVAFAAR